jgi:hypothetical protein
MPGTENRHLGHQEGRLGPAEVERVLRRAAEINARRPRVPQAGFVKGTMGGAPKEPTVSPEVLAQVAAAAGIPEGDVRRALGELRSEKAYEPENLSFKLFGPSRMRVVRELDHPHHESREYLEHLMRVEQGLKMRMRTDVGSLWDSGDMLGMVRRALDFSGEKALLKARSVELRVEDVDGERCGADLIADVSNQRGEYLSLSAILGATLAVLFALAGAQNAVFLLGVIPALAAPGLGFRFAYGRACAEIRRSLDRLLDAAEKGPPRERSRDRSDLKPGQIRGLKPIPRFAPQQRGGE